MICDNSALRTAHSHKPMFFNITTPAGSTVVLRGLDFNALGENGGNGQAVIMFNGAGVLHLHKVRISYVHTDTTNGAVRVDISNSTVSNNANNGLAIVGGAGGQNR
jgi:hypothetical protein